MKSRKHVYTEEQIQILNSKFEVEKYPNKGEIMKTSEQLNIPMEKLKVNFKF